MSFAHFCENYILLDSNLQPIPHDILTSATPLHLTAIPPTYVSNFLTPIPPENNHQLQIELVSDYSNYSAYYTASEPLHPLYSLILLSHWHLYMPPPASSSTETDCAEPGSVLKPLLHQSLVHTQEILQNFTEWATTQNLQFIPATPKSPLHTISVFLKDPLSQALITFKISYALLDASNGPPPPLLEIFAESPNSPDLLFYCPSSQLPIQQWTQELHTFLQNLRLSQLTC